ncbi:MAG: hypothetical protein ACK424_04250 [Candidatus Thermochlorobacter sp.]
MQKTGFSPTFREIKEHFGFASLYAEPIKQCCKNRQALLHSDRQTSLSECDCVHPTLDVASDNCRSPRHRRR